MDTIEAVNAMPFLLRGIFFFLIGWFVKDMVTFCRELYESRKNIAKR